MSDVLSSQAGAVLTLTINRPKARNSLVKSVLTELSESFTKAASDATIRTVVLKGAEGHFCAGADLKQTFAEDPDLLDRAEEYMDRFHAVILAIVRCPKPIVAQMQGGAVGFGADLALACDFRTASHDAYLQEKFTKIGLLPDGGGTLWLPKLLGLSRAMQLVLLAEKLDAKTMNDWGLLTRLTAPAGIDATTEALAAELALGSPLAFAASKRAMHASLGSIEDALKRERTEQVKLLRSNDCMEGVMAWAQKRTPNFVGQ